MPHSVLFICLGNICRSPIAEAILRHKVKKRGIESEWEIDSAGTGSWHVGNLADPNALRVLQERGGMMSEHRVRVLTEQDFTKFDVIFGIDHENMDNLNERKPSNSTASLELLGSYDPQGQLIIKDPYYYLYSDFEKVYDQCVRCCKAYLDKMAQMA